MVIRAVVEQGQIRLLEPLPSEWVEGRELRVLEAESAEDTQENELWIQEMNALAREANDPEDWARMAEVLAEADTQAKAQVRHEMRLP
jgi:hypothetical protein